MPCLLADLAAGVDPGQVALAPFGWDEHGAHADDHDASVVAVVGRVGGVAGPARPPRRAAAAGRLNQPDVAQSASYGWTPMAKMWIEPLLGKVTVATVFVASIGIEL